MFIFLLLICLLLQGGLKSKTQKGIEKIIFAPYTIYLKAREMPGLLRGLLWIFFWNSCIM